ncbi:MAG: zinc-binding dehydrogenase [Candidatus Marinimicrobia bacterium]|nr:zinc-binding dehydrogenase [Candidatus Neomarinimicrobiota bacterium]
MKIAKLRGAHDFVIENMESPKIGKNECLIKVKACGVCHSEIDQWANTLSNLEYPRFIGHEVSGEIIQVGSQVEKFNPGDRVAVWVDQKGYASEVAVASERIFPIDDSVSFEEAMAEPLSCTTNGVIEADIELADTVALVGTGFMGLILLQQIKLKGATKVIAIDIRDDILEVATQLGADVTLNPNRVNIEKWVKKITDGKGVDAAFEVGGKQATLDLTSKIIRMEGKLIIFGYHPGRREIEDLGYWNWMAFKLINAHFRNMKTILQGADIGIKLLNSGKVQMKPLITHTFPLEEIEKAFQAAKNKPEGFIKSVITFR